MTKIICVLLWNRESEVWQAKSKSVGKQWARISFWDIPARLLGFPQAPDLPLARPVEHAFRRGFALPAVASSCTSAQKINPHTTLKEAQTKQKTLKYFRPRRVIITQGRSFAVYGRKGYGFITKARCCFWTVGCQYRFTLGHKRKQKEIILGFSETDFHHLAGLHKLRDISIARESLQTVFRDILAGRITYWTIEKSVFVDESRLRLETLQFIEDLLDGEQLVPQSSMEKGLRCSGSVCYGCRAFKEEKGEW